MKKLVALSAIGKDQPGIVASLTKVLFEKGCNLEDSSMTRLQGDFAILLLIALPAGLSTSELERALSETIRNRGLTLALRELGPGEVPSGSPTPSLPYTLVVYGVDHPGIVYRVAQEAAERKINITDLRTHITGKGPQALYSLAMEVEIPNSGVLRAFQEQLGALKKELQVELTLNPVETDEL